MIESTAQGLQTAGGAEREARELALQAQNEGYLSLNLSYSRLERAIASALEQAAVSIEKLHQGAEDYYTFEIGHVRADGAAAIRALKAAPEQKDSISQREESQ